MSADSVKAKFRPLIKSLNWTKCCRVKIDPNQQVRRLISPVFEGTIFLHVSNGELSTHATVQDISPGDNVEVTVNIAPYFNREYFGNGLKCTDVVLTTKQPKFDAAARERERVVEAANAAARERERAVEAENAAATRKQERNKARRLIDIEYAERMAELQAEKEKAEAELQAEKEKAEAAIENSDTDE